MRVCYVCCNRGSILLVSQAVGLKSDVDNRVYLFSLFLIVGESNHWQFSTHIKVESGARYVNCMQMPKGQKGLLSHKV